ncbi:MAG: chromosomal replication initiator protein DnaA [Candidatus Aphodousia sp.]|nr:chromosomal replication initiator protein DnaA [Candidatus Aphodousia sp.]
MQFWQQCLEKLSDTLNSAQDYNRWIAPLQCLDWDEVNKTLVLGHSSLPKLETVESQFGTIISTIASEICQENVTIQYRQSGTDTEVDTGQETLNFERKTPTEQAYASGLRPQQTFESFVAGSSNQMAYVAAQNVGDNPGKNYNPLFIYGGVGLGKTHLMHAVGNQILTNNPQARVLCVGSQTFINDFTTAVRDNKYTQFDQKYQNIDALFIDDIQYLSGKRQSQQKLFDIFEKLVPHGKQVILTSDTYARSLQDVDERLISRFTSGLSVEVEPPELETRVAILQKKSRSQNYDLPTDVAYFIARHLKSNVRELEGALNSVIAFARFSNEQRLTVEKAREALQSILVASTAQLTVERIQGVVAEYFKVSLAEMYSKTRVRAIAVPRQVAMYLSKELTQSSLAEIGERFGKRDHTTVMHACRTITEKRAKDKDLNYQIHVLEQMLKN